MHSKNYGIHIAKIVGNASAGNSRLQVRVLPEMELMPASQCPIWPSFFANEIVGGSLDETVWVLCDDEFNVGYVLGLANKFGESDQSYEENSVKESFLQDFNDTEKAFYNQTRTSIDVRNILVTYWDENCLHFIDRATGSTTVCYRTGSFFTVAKDMMAMIVGSSTLRVDSSGIALDAARISLNSKNITLGNEIQGYVMVGAGSESGKNAMPSTCVQA